MAESLADEFWSLEDTNWNGKAGELDIVAQRKGTLLVVEVKTRNSKYSEHYHPLNAIDQRKEEKIETLSKEYIRRNWLTLKRRRVHWLQYEWIGVVYTKRLNLIPTFKIYQRILSEKIKISER